MISFAELQTKWNEMSRSQEGYILISGEHKLSFHIGYNSSHQKSFVLLDSGMVSDIPSSNAISAKCIKTDDCVCSLQFSLQFNNLEDVFTLLCWDLMDSSNVEGDPLGHLIDRYNNWHKLLQKGNFVLLSNIQIKGLIGELLYLEKLIDIYGEQIALNSWIGPDGFDQDFVLLDKWVEIKTVAISADGVIISSLQQLERADYGELSIFFMDKSSPNDSKAYSLEKVVNNIENKLSTQNLRDKFWCKLMWCGCFKHHLNKYSEPKYRLAENRTYCIKDGFPRLVRATVPVEIMSAKYTISLASIKKFQITKD